MFGLGILKGMGVTLKHFLETYLADVGQFPRRYRADAAAVRQAPRERGLFTVQYPEEKLAVPERFRYLPMLLYEEESGEERCTACGICAKVCPPQCIWIVRAVGEDGKPEPRAEEFCIDVSVCMSCGFCAEFCPFDAIKMDHRYELSSYERHETLVYDKRDLLVSTEYYARTHPTAWAEEEAVRRKKEAARARVKR
ncbi:MAG: NuoI/complex I 23 kDa subunit family protein [Anaerolineae bacterium]